MLSSPIAAELSLPDGLESSGRHPVSVSRQSASHKSAGSGVCRPCQPACCLLVMSMAALLPGFMTGCSSLRNRLACRSAECTQLCEESRQARESGNDAEAEQLLNAAIRRRPTATQAKLDIAEELWSSGRQIAAADVLSRMAAERPDDAPLLLRLARMEFEIGRTAAAEEALRTALQLDPENLEGLRLRAEVAEQHRDWNTALASYHRMLQIWPDDLDAQMAMAVIHIHRGQADRAAPILRTLAQHPQATLVQRRKAEWQLGVAYAHAERWSDAANCMLAAIDEQTATAEDWYRIAYAQSRSGNIDAAYASLSRSLELKPQYDDALQLARNLHSPDHTLDSVIVPAGFIPGTMADGSVDDARRRL